MGKRSITKARHRINAQNQRGAVEEAELHVLHPIQQQVYAGQIRGIHYWLPRAQYGNDARSYPICLTTTRDSRKLTARPARSYP